LIFYQKFKHMAYPTDPIYKLVKDPSTNTETLVFGTINGIQWQIPFDNDNTQYQDYLAWVDAGNTAEAAD
tara:strand:- start:48 stop:257 length:210 start_codon:yes stop_codon:yes gene_type:complete